MQRVCGVVRAADARPAPLCSVCLVSARRRARAVGGSWPAPPRPPRPSDARSPPKTPAPAPPAPVKKPAPQDAPRDLPPGVFARDRSAYRGLALAHLMNRPTEGMRSPFADESMQVSEDWKALYATVSAGPFPEDVAAKLAVEIGEEDLEVRPETGWVYLKRSRYQDILDDAFGFAGWHLVPRGPLTLSGRTISRPYALMARNQFVSEARGDYSPPGGTFPANPANDPAVNAALEYAALVRCCKDLGVASALWDPKFVARFRKKAGGS
ncbi:mitochondrial genome maintenance MGM101-domain-containing protein [Hyaloraphidium curvatum]|nr:mitochondrial genome maintenance MGM101-domain-containing protein [Hyaloraphidium curvatum]